MTQHLSLIAELDRAVADGTVERRAQLVQQLSDLFVFGANAYSDDQVALFDDVFTHLIATIELSARAALAERLAKIPLAPPGACRTLAFDDTIEVAGPVLQHSGRLDSATLAEIARKKGQQHLLAISKRNSLEAVVTEILVERGDQSVLLSTAANPGSQFSEAGYTMLVGRSAADDELAACVGLRRDLPRHHLLRLLTRASETVRRKIEAADPLSAAAIRKAIAETVSRVQAASRRVSRDYAAARIEIEQLAANGSLDEAAIAGFAAAGKFEETTIALSLLGDLPLEQVELAMAGDRLENVLILARAVGISWPTVKLIIGLREQARGIRERTLDQSLGIFARLKPATARQVVQFQRARSNPAA
jgi:uncharacterized protein (DUF2336 family)